MIDGKPGGILDPKGTATRAEVAQIVLNYVCCQIEAADIDALEADAKRLKP